MDFSGIVIGGHAAGEWRASDQPTLNIPIPVHKLLSPIMATTAEPEMMTVDIARYRFRHLISRNGESPITAWVLEGVDDWDAVREVFRHYRDTAQRPSNDG